MVRFDTRKKKPKVYGILIVLLITAGLLIFHVSQPEVNPFMVGMDICAGMLATVVILAVAFVRQLQYNPYSYNTIIYMGFSLFLLITAFTVLLTANHLRLQTGLASATALYNLLGTLVNAGGNYLFSTAPFLFLFSVALMISNVVLIQKEGRSFVNLLGIILALLLIGGFGVFYWIGYYASGSVFEVMIHDMITNLLSTVYLYFECMLIGAMIANLIVIRYEPEPDADFIITLGCGIRSDGTPTPLLAGRVDRALAFYQKQIQLTGKAPVFVTSGGQGPNEVISESQCMKNYLLSKGVPEEHILMEDKSTTTLENMRNSKEIIDSVKPDAKILFSTSNYHLFRSGIWSRRVKMRSIGIGAKTKWYFWPNATVREFVGLLTEHRMKQGLILGGMLLLSAFLTYASYYLW